MTYYLKYRPQKIQDLDLKEVRDSLTKLVKSKSFPHAFLFYGPKGSGKTSAARIIAKVVNCQSTSKMLRGEKLSEPCNRCSVCEEITSGQSVDVLELDAASHRGIDDVRAIRNAVKLAPISAKKKVYIIDEAHMLTTEASNALLKTLEEPPSHVLFILATTNPEKLIETVRSRTTPIKFGKASQEELVRSLTKVVKGEGLKYKEDVLDEIARESGGSFRDATKLLEKLVGEKIRPNVSTVREFLKSSGGEDVVEFLKIVYRKETSSALEWVEKMVKAGHLINNIINDILDAIRESLLAKEGLGEDQIEDYQSRELVVLYELLLTANDQLSISPVEQLPLEIAIIKWCRRHGEKTAETQRQKPDDNQEDLKPEIEKKRLLGKHRKRQRDQDEVLADSSATGSDQSGISNLTDDVWTKILQTIRPINTSIEALLRAAKPINFDGNTLRLGVFYKFHKERLEEARNRLLLEDVVKKVLASPAKVVCVLTEPPAKKIIETKPEAVLTETADEDIVKVAEDIFG